MPIIIKNENGVQTIHISERLEIQLLASKEVVEDMVIRVWFNIETRLPDGDTVGQPYWDKENVLELSCKDNPELAAAMTIIQQVIGQARYQQITAPSETPNPIQDLRTVIPENNEI